MLYIKKICYMAHLNLPDSGVFRVSGSSLRLQLLYTLTCVFCFFNRTFYANVPCLRPPGPTARPHRGPELWPYQDSRLWLTGPGCQLPWLPPCLRLALWHSGWQREAASGDSILRQPGRHLAQSLGPGLGRGALYWQVLQAAWGSLRLPGSGI